MRQGEPGLPLKDGMDVDEVVLCAQIALPCNLVSHQLGAAGGSENFN